MGFKHFLLPSQCFYKDVLNFEKFDHYDQQNNKALDFPKVTSQNDYLFPNIFLIVVLILQVSNINHS